MPSSRILVVGPSWVGDMVMAQSLFVLLRQQDPDCLIDVLAPGWSLPLLERMPQVNEGIEMPLAHGELDLGKRKEIGKSLREKGYDQAILLPNSFKSALIPWWAKIPKRTGWKGEARYILLNDRRKLDKNRLTMTVQRFAALAYPKKHKEMPETPAPKLSVRMVDIHAALKDLEITKGDKPVLVLCPGAEYGPAKQWPTESYAGLAASYVEQGWDVWLFGSEKDQPVTEAIAAAAGESVLDLAGKTSLAQAVDLMAVADAVVSNDSGLMHVAAALGRKLVAIYGSSDPGFTPPLNENCKVISLGLECSPCFKRECPLEHLDCLRNISVDQVDKALQELISQYGNRR